MAGDYWGYPYSTQPLCSLLQDRTGPGYQLQWWVCQRREVLPAGLQQLHLQAEE